MTMKDVDTSLTVRELFTEGWQRFLNIKLTTHMFAGAAITLGAMWQDAAFRAQVTEIFKSMPHSVQAAIGTGVVVYSAYKRTHKVGQ